MDVTEPQLGLMCVDDSEFVCEALRMTFTRRGWRWLGSLNRADDICATVLAMPYPDRPDLVVFDIQMPGRDAFEAAVELLGCSPQTEVIFFTVCEPEHDQRAKSIGAIGCVSKSKGMDALLEIVEQAFGDRLPKN